MDSLQAKTLSEMRMHELTIESYEKCKARELELIKEIQETDDILNAENGIDKLIVGELREGIKKFGTPRRSNVIPYKISFDTEVMGDCILQLSSEGMILRKTSSNVEEEPIPIDSNGFAVKVGNECSFIAIDENGNFSFIRVKEIPVDSEVPLNRFIQRKLSTIVALLPFDLESSKCAILISRKGMIKKVIINEMKPSKRPCIEIGNDDKLVRGIVTKKETSKGILIYTLNGMGQMIDPNQVRITSHIAKGINGFKLQQDDEIIGCYSISPENQYLLYVTAKGKVRLNLLEYISQRDSKHEEMLRLITLTDRDHLLTVIGCNKYDKLIAYYDDQTTETIEIEKLMESTMSSLPIKVVKKNMVSTNIVKVKLV
jgi:DNA gyrase/topoisomerase IV subunit A